MGGRGGSGNRAAAIVKTPSAPVATPAATPVASGSIEDRIVAEFPTLPTHWHDGKWATLEGLRARLSDVDRADLDAALKRLDRARVIHLERDVDQKNISRSENEAALSFGGKMVTMYRVL